MVSSGFSSISIKAAPLQGALLLLLRLSNGLRV
jgi:hypothetical protein